MTSLYFFGWPDHVGGASTKLAHLLALLAPHYSVYVIPDDEICFEPHEWLGWMEHVGVTPIRLKDLPEQLEGWAVALCHGEFFSKGYSTEAKRRGLRIAWSSEMMWLYRAEKLAVFAGEPDVILYVSEVQREALEPSYWFLWNGEERPGNLPRQQQGMIPGNNERGPLRWVMTGNYIDPTCFPFLDRSQNRRFSETVVGRLSRPDPLKFPENFPSLYEALDQGNTRFRIMAWDKKMGETWPQHVFDRRWEFLKAMQESQHRFLQSLDIFAYGVGPHFKESWGRSTVEAMLCGAVPLVPRGDGHHLDQLVAHGISGFTYGSDEEFIEYGRMLARDEDLRGKMSVATREWAVTRLCDEQEHLAQWRRVFDDPPDGR
jgi:hypothetical protein